MATNANDDNLTTYWEGGAYPATLTVSLGANANISSVVVKLNPDPIWGLRTQTIQVMGHNQTTSTFTSPSPATTYTFNPASGANAVTIPVTATASDVQLVFTSNSGAPSGQCAEFQVLGTWAPNPDLTISTLAWSPSAPIETDTITLTAAIRNAGTASAPASNVNFYLGTTLVGTAASPALAAGASANVALNIGARAAGTYAVKAVVDEANTVVEIDNANNAATGSMVVSAVPSSDLVGAVTWSPRTERRKQCRLHRQPRQSGEHRLGQRRARDHPHPQDDGRRHGADFSGSFTGTLNAGASVNVAMGSWTAANGSYSLTTTIAADGNEILSRQANNTTTTSFFVGHSVADMPYTKIEAESAGVAFSGTKLAPNYKLADYAGEASGRSAIYLNATGQYVEFTLPAAANAFVMRNAVPNTSDGAGADYTVSVYVDGVSKGETRPIAAQLRRKFEQALVDRAQLLGLHVAPIDRDRGRMVPQPGEPKDRLHEIAVSEPGVLQIDKGARREQAAERRQAEPFFAASERCEGDQQSFPAIVVPVPAARRTAWSRKVPSE